MKRLNITRVSTPEVNRGWNEGESSINQKKKGEKVHHFISLSILIRWHVRSCLHFWHNNIFRIEKPNEMMNSLSLSFFPFILDFPSIHSPFTSSVKTPRSVVQPDIGKNDINKIFHKLTERISFSAKISK